jgi:hypothetical protein
LVLRIEIVQEDSKAVEFWIQIKNCVDCCMFSFSRFSWHRIGCAPCCLWHFKSHPFPIMAVHTCVASWALQRAGPSFTVCDDSTMETQDATAWFQRSMFRGADTDTTMTTAAVHCCSDLLGTSEKSTIVCHC